MSAGAILFSYLLIDDYDNANDMYFMTDIVAFNLQNKKK